MANTFSQIYIHIVFAVKGRDNLLQKPWRDNVVKYITGIINKKNHKSIIVNGEADHVHCFIGFNPSYALSDLVRDIKNNSSNYINNTLLIPKCIFVYKKIINVQGLSKKSKKSMRHKTKLIEKRSQEGIMPLK